MAIDCYDEAIKYKPNFATAYFNKGSALSDLGKKKEAIDCYDEAIKYKPNYADAYNNKGLVLIYLG